MLQDLREWVAYHVELGVSRFYIYDNNSTMPLMNELTDFIKVHIAQSNMKSRTQAEHTRLKLQQSQALRMQSYYLNSKQSISREASFLLALGTVYQHKTFALNKDLCHAG